MSEQGTTNNLDSSKDQAVKVIRAKIDELYKKEPDAKEELTEVKQHKPLSKHQLYMYELSRSGKSLAEIQTAWHNYYLNLSDQEKHEVWQEFYEEHNKRKQHNLNAPPEKKQITETVEFKRATNEPKSVDHVKKQILKTKVQPKISRSGHIKSLLFGAAMGGITLIVVLFGFFNERFIAPFITPSKTVSSTPIIIDPNNLAVGNENKIIIPKINVEVPVVYDVNTIDEKSIQKGLERGVVHYATTPEPGEQGNSVIVGHSSNNLLNPGKYKFVFVMLKQLNEGDTFMLTKGGKRYIYRVYSKKIVKPNDTSVLGPTSKLATVTLITCDPPGTSINRLVVVGEQITPDPSTNKKGHVRSVEQSQLVPGNAPSLWARIWDWLTN